MQFEDDIGFQADSQGMATSEGSGTENHFNQSNQHQYQQNQQQNVYNSPFQNDSPVKGNFEESEGSGQGGGQLATDYDNEPPILEELGIKPDEIMKKFIAILTQRGFAEVSTYEDMAGAIFTLFLFGCLLMMVSGVTYSN